MRWALLSLLVSSTALAQMPSPRARSGIAIGDERVAAGTLVVRVVHDEENAYAAAGQPVHLVGLRADRKVALTTQKVDAEGKVEFTGLDLDQATIYYVLAVVGEDRLESQPVTMPPKVGMRMSLSARKRGPDGKPVGEPIDDQAKDRDVPTPPAGEAWLVVQGRSLDQATITLIPLSGGEPKTGKPTGESERRELRFTGLASGPDAVYIAEANHGGRVYRSLPFMLTLTAGASRGILLYEKPLAAIQGGAAMDDDRLGFELGITLFNLTGAPWDTGPEGLFIPLPEGFVAAGANSEQLGDRVKVIPGEGLRVHGMLPPGQVQVVTSFALPVKDGGARFRMIAPLGLFESQIFIEKGPRTVVTSEKLPAPAVTPLQGKEYFALEITLGPNDVLGFEVLGLPQRPSGDRALRLIAGALVLLLLAWGLMATLSVRNAPSAGEQAAARRKLLERDREHLYGELVALEKKRRAEEIADAAYTEARRALVARLVLVHRELDELAAPRAPS